MIAVFAFLSKVQNRIMEKTGKKFLLLNMSYLTDSYIIFIFKMDSVLKNAIFGLKLEKVITAFWLARLGGGGWSPLRLPAQ